MFQYGRYLLMASSRPGSPPANLQGIWNDAVQPPWSANYTINVNTEMNYWAAEVVGLPECHEPLLEHIEVVARHGARVARELYGCDGWMAHHNTDVWGQALAVGAGQGAACWADWWMGGVWISRHLWEHFEFSGDLTFLRERAWPLLRGAAAFCLDWLVEDEDGMLATLPSTSPENTYLTADGAASLTRSCAMDLTLIGDLFDTCARAGDLLGLADPVVDRARAARPRLAGLRLGARGQVCEWDADPDEVDPHHRHLSPLVGLHPLDLIDLDRTPQLAAAARRTLDLRGPGSTGWSLAWKLTMQARLGSGDAAADLIAQALTPAPSGAGGPWAGGLHPNLFATHPPFQIDGNLAPDGGHRGDARPEPGRRHSAAAGAPVLVARRRRERAAASRRSEHRSAVGCRPAAASRDQCGAPLRSPGHLRRRHPRGRARSGPVLGARGLVGAWLLPTAGSLCRKTERILTFPGHASASADRSPTGRDTGRTLAAARAVGAEPRFERVDGPLTSVDVYDVTFPGHDGDPIRGWLTCPKNPTGPWRRWSSSDPGAARPIPSARPRPSPAS